MQDKEEIKRIEYWGSYTVKKLICSGYEVKLSDFEYTSNDNKKYLMYMTKGYHGAYHVIKSLVDNKLYVTDNLWTGDKDKNRNAIVIALNINHETLIKKFGDKELNYVNTLDFVEPEDLDKIKQTCEKSIKRIIEENYIRENTKYYLRISNDGEDYWSHLYSQPLSYDSDKIGYFFRIGSHYGDFEDRFDTLDEAIEECAKSIKNHNEHFINDYKRNKYLNYDSDDSENDDEDYNNYKIRKYTDHLISMRIENINKEIMDKLKEHNINLYKTNTNDLSSLIYAYLLCSDAYNFFKNKFDLIKLD